MTFSPVFFIRSRLANSRLNNNAGFRFQGGGGDGLGGGGAYQYRRRRKRGGGQGGGTSSSSSDFAAFKLCIFRTCLPKVYRMRQ